MAKTKSKLEICDRQHGLGGTDIAAIIGQSPFKSPMDVFLAKKGKAPLERKESFAMDRGTAMEGVILKWWMKEYGVAKAVVQPKNANRQGQAWRRTDRIWHVGSLDGVEVDLGGQPTVYDDPTSSRIARELAAKGRIERVVEVKSAGKWGAARFDRDTGEIPVGYLVQVAWYMALVECDRAVVVADLDGQIAEFPISRDMELETSLLEAGEKFYKDHILTGKPPQWDGSDSASEFIREKFPRNSKPLAVVTDEATVALLNDYAAAQNALNESETRRDTLKQAIQAVIGDAEGLEWPGGRITWKNNKDGERTDWKAAFAEASKHIGQAQAAKILQSNTTTQPGARVFRATFKGE